MGAGRCGIGITVPLGGPGWWCGLCKRVTTLADVCDILPADSRCHPIMDVSARLRVMGGCSPLPSCGTASVCRHWAVTLPVSGNRSWNIVLAADGKDFGGV